MYKQKLKEAVGRAAAFSAAVTMVSILAAGAILPGVTMADALNPLTERTLLLSSSSPGWDYLDGSGNGLYAPPGSGANGQKTGETFTFKTSTDSTATGVPVKAFTFQYCVGAAGECQAPGDDAVGPPRNDDSSHSDLNVVTSSPAEGTDFEIYLNGVASSGWSMTASNLEDSSNPHTGKNNFITLTNATGVSPTAGEPIKVVFFASATNYITNPGSGAFFVKINDYNSDVLQNFRDAYPDTANHCDADHTTYDASSGTTTCNQNVIDGGVTVANVMNNSIEIQTKVLETMDFSVGTVDPDTLTEAVLGHPHGQCESILPAVPGSSAAANTIALGDPTLENSLSTAQPYDGFSYWRLSSNSANGGTVYFSGATLHNTENNAIAPLSDIPNSDASVAPLAGTEQFGLGIDTDADALDPAFVTEVASHTSDPIDYWHDPTLSPLSATPSYGHASGALTSAAQFAFNASANTTPVPIASENTQVVDCATGKMRYVADIAATTPAGIYTTKINYLAAPEY